MIYLNIDKKAAKLKWLYNKSDMLTDKQVVKKSQKQINRYSRRVSKQELKKLTDDSY